jgi:hypothetical protein
VRVHSFHYHIQSTCWSLLGACFGDSGDFVEDESITEMVFESNQFSLSHSPLSLGHVSLTSQPWSR